MKIVVQAKPRSKKVYVKRIDAMHFVVAVKESPEGGKANKAVLRALAEYFGVGSSRVRMASGHAARQKVIEILE